MRGGSGEGGVFVVRVAGADRPSRGLVRVPKRLPALDDGGVPTRAVRPGVGPGGDALVDSGADPVAPDRVCVSRCDSTSGGRARRRRLTDGSMTVNIPVRGNCVPYQKELCSLPTEPGSLGTEPGSLPMGTVFPTYGHGVPYLWERCSLLRIGHWVPLRCVQGSRRPRFPALAPGLVFPIPGTLDPSAADSRSR